MIYSNQDVYDFAVHIDEVIEVPSFKLGAFNFIIDDVFIPGRGTNYTLEVVILELKSSLGIKRRPKGAPALEEIPEAGNDELTAEQLNSGEGRKYGFLELSASELADKNCLFRLAFAGEEERLFYSTDFGESFKEKRLPRGTVEAVIRSLPDMVATKR